MSAELQLNSRSSDIRFLSGQINRPAFFNMAKRGLLVTLVAVAALPLLPLLPLIGFMHLAAILGRTRP